jgi:hypothetical protein
MTLPFFVIVIMMGTQLLAGMISCCQVLGDRLVWSELVLLLPVTVNRVLF